MSSDNVIQSIQSTEQEAEAAVASANETARKEIQKIESEYSGKISMMKELLVAEISEIAEETKKKGLAFKEKISSDVKKELQRIESAAAKNKSDAVSFVTKAFNDHVGQ